MQSITRACQAICATSVARSMSCIPARSRILSPPGRMGLAIRACVSRVLRRRRHLGQEKERAKQDHLRGPVRSLSAAVQLMGYPDLPSRANYSNTTTTAKLPAQQKCGPGSTADREGRHWQRLGRYRPESLRASRDHSTGRASLRAPGWDGLRRVMSRSHVECRTARLRPALTPPP